MSDAPRIAVGPLLYHWPRRDLAGFYEQLSASSAQIVYLGETVCAKRTEWRSQDWLDAAARLLDAGKQVVLSTLALIEAESELGVLRRLCANSDYWVEANDMAAVHQCHRQKQPFVAGPALNIYNTDTLALLAGCGMQRWVAPVELDADGFRTVLEESRSRGLGFETEIFAWGHLPLAYSARCFTARAHNLPKDRCAFRCLDYPDGMPLRTRDGVTAFTLNGVQTQSGAHHELCSQWQSLAADGVDILRISPQSQGTLETVEEMAAAIAEQRVPELPPPSAERCDGYWYGAAGMRRSAGPS